MKPLKQWIKEDAEPIKKLMESHPEQFFRDPVRPMYLDDSYFFAPADGVVLYVTYVKNDKKLFDIKGSSFTISDLLEQDISYPVIVVGIFMTAEDVHVNRMPYTGYLKWKQLNCIKTRNYPMLFEEQDLLKGIIKYDDMDYLFYNERVVNKVFSLKLGFPFYIVQVADYDVDTITPFFLGQNELVNQNERFSMIRFGSQVDLIVPVLPEYKYKFECEVLTHVEAGIDRLIRIEKR